MKITNIKFTAAGYGHVQVSGQVEGRTVRFTTTEMTKTDAAQDETEEKHESAMSWVKAQLCEVFTSTIQSHE